MSAIAKRKYTLEEYLELEKNSEERYEYFDGEVFAMAGGSLNHALLTGNVYSDLKLKLKGEACKVFNSEMRLKVPKALPYRYPDVSVACGPLILDEIDGLVRLVNPILIVEVLSPTTSTYDLKDKFTEYQSIDSFKEYLIVSQNRPQVIQHTRQTGKRWLRTEIEGLDSFVILDSVNVSLAMKDIYEDVEFNSADGAYWK